MHNNKPSPTQDSNTKSRILVCDDSKIVRLSAQKILAERFDLVLAEDGEQGWEILCDDPSVQMVFTDLRMPRLDGFGLIQRARTSEDERIRNLPIIVITGAGEEEDVKRKVFDIGATDFITKPFKPTAIIARADAHTNYRQVNSELQKNVNIDTLTGVLNRKGLDEQLAKDISFINRHAENLAVMIFELDDFDRIYDRIGRKTAEDIAKTVAKLLLSAVRKEDSIGREGLTKFIVSLPMAKPDGVINLTKRLCEKVATFQLKAGGEQIALTASAGVAAAKKGDAVAADAIVQCAEQALQNARSLGPGEVQFLKLEAEGGEGKTGFDSIDALLEQIELGHGELVRDNMDFVLQRLAPLVTLMDDQQKRRLLAGDSPPNTAP